MKNPGQMQIQSLEKTPMCVLIRLKDYLTELLVCRCIYAHHFVKEEQTKILRLSPSQPQSAILVMEGLQQQSDRSFKLAL